MDGAEDSVNTPRRSYLFHPLLLLLIAAGTLFFGQLSSPLQEPEEPRYAEIPREMLASGNLMIPVLNDQPYYDKPPLLYWLVMGSYRLFGVHDWSARLVSSSVGFLTIIVTWIWGRSVANARAAFAGALVLCLSARFVYLGRLLTMNGLLCACVVTALAAGHFALCGSRLRCGWWLLSALTSGLGLLTKGPVALVLVAPPLIGYQIWQRRPGWSLVRAWLMYLSVAFAVAGPWYACIACRNPSFAGYFFWKHNVERYLAPFDHVKPVWFFSVEVFSGLFPWSIVFPLLALYGARRVAGQRSGFGTSPHIFFLLCSGWCLLFYSLAGSKRAGYILPALPPLALACGCIWDRTLVQMRRELVGRWSRAGAVAAIATFMVLACGLYWLEPSYAGRFALREQSESVGLPASELRPVIACYPRHWDSVSFYLERTDIQVYSEQECNRLIQDLIADPQLFAFIKTDQALDAFQALLPAAWEFVPCSQPGPAIVGRLRRRSKD
jgi:4-amino-4-deoxy-L-arabinose transferase-like glycosyltransferase